MEVLYGVEYTQCRSFPIPYHVRAGILYRPTPVQRMPPVVQHHTLHPASSIDIVKRMSSCSTRRSYVYNSRECVVLEQEDSNSMLQYIDREQHTTSMY